MASHNLHVAWASNGNTRYWYDETASCNARSASNDLYNIVGGSTRAFNIGSASSDVNFKVFAGSTQYFQIDYGTSAMTLSGVSLELDDNDLTIGDNDYLIFGDSDDVKIAWSGANDRLDITFNDDDREIRFGNGTNNVDLLVYGSNSTNTVDFDASGDLLTFTNISADITGTWEMQTTSKLQFHDSGIYIHASADGKLKLASDGGSTDDITLSGTVTLDDNLYVPDDKSINLGGSQDVVMAWNGTGNRLDITFNDDDREIRFGNGTNNVDLLIYGSDSTNQIDFDASGDLLTFTGISADITGTWEMQTTSKLQFHDAGIYIHASADGKLKLASDGGSTDDITLSGSVTLDDDITTGSGKGFASDMRMQTTSKVEFYDAGIYIHASADGKLKLASDGGSTDDITLSGTVTLDDNLYVPDDKSINFGGSQDVVMAWSSTGNRLDITFADDDREIRFGNGTNNVDLLIYGSDSTNQIDFDASGDLLTFTNISADITGTWEMQTDSKLQFYDAGIYIHASADGKLKIASDGGSTDDITLSGTITLDDDITTGSGKGFASACRWSAANKAEFRDGDIYIQSSTDGTLDVVSDSILYLNAPVVKRAVHSTTLTGNKTLGATSTTILFYDPDGNRTITLPAEASSTGLVFEIYNWAGGAEDIEIRDDASNVICTVQQGEGSRVACDGTVWRGGVWNSS